MRKLIFNFALVFLLVIVWVALTENGTLPNIFAGVFFAMLTVILIQLLQRGESVLLPRYFSPWNLFIYAIYLTGQIYIAGFQMIRLIFRGELHVDMVDVETSLKSDLAISVLACSITLTPGTVTVMREDQFLKVLWIDCKSRDTSIAGSQIKKQLEQILLRPEKKLTK